MAEDRELEQRLPPHDQAAERSVIGSMLRDNSVIAPVTLVVNAKSFYQYAHQVLFDAIKDLFVNRRIPADPVTLADYLHEKNVMQDIGGAAYIIDLWDAAPSTSNVEHYAQIVRGSAIRRALIQIGHKIQGLGFECGDWKEGLDEAERLLFGISQKVRTTETVPFADAVDGYLTIMDERAKNIDRKLLNTGLTHLDAITGGFGEGQLIIIGARPGVGKTILAMNLAFDIADEGHTVSVISLEQSKEELAERMLANRSGVPSYQLRNARIELASDTDRFFEAVNDLKRSSVLISDTPKQTANDICAGIRMAVNKKKASAIFIDYLQLVEPEDKKVNRQEQVSEITRQMKLVARETGARVFLLAQINRESEKAADKRPQLHQLRESGAIEANADVALLLHCEDQTSNEMEIIVAKNRFGLNGIAKVFFDRKRLKILNRV
jgi:replicative DNA helicase